MAELLKSEEKALFSLRRLYQCYGYSQFKMCKFEPYELYMQNKDFLVSDGIITFTDTDGTLMALKPDVTLSIVKNYRPSTPLQKVHYSENVYRIAGASHSYREIMQTGLECLGDVGLYEITEVILLAAKSLQAISERFVLDLSHLQIIADLMDSLILRYDQRASILQAIADKNEDALSLDGSDTSLLLDLLKISGPIEASLPRLSPLCKTEQSKYALYQLQALCEILKQNGLSDRVQLDFSLVNDMNYYNGIVFRGYVEGIPTGVLSGGQYDKLMEKMGKPASGIGFAVYLDQLERLDPRNKAYDVDTVLLYTSQDSITALSEAAKALTTDGQSVVLHRSMPVGLRYRKLARFENGRVIFVEEHG